MKKLSNAEADLKKSAAYKRSLDWKPEKKGRISVGDQRPFYLQVFQRLC